MCGVLLVKSLYQNINKFHSSTFTPTSAVGQRLFNQKIGNDQGRMERNPQASSLCVLGPRSLGAGCWRSSAFLQSRTEKAGLVSINRLDKKRKKNSQDVSISLQVSSPLASPSCLWQAALLSSQLERMLTLQTNRSQQVNH